MVKVGNLVIVNKDFNPNQPRYPKGHPLAGQWMDTNAAGNDAAPDTASGDSVGTLAPAATIHPIKVKVPDAKNQFIADEVQPRLEDLEAEGFTMPEKVVVRSPLTKDDFGGGFFGRFVEWNWANEMGIAAYRHDENTLYFNPGSRFWKMTQEEREEETRLNHEVGWWSSADPYHVVNHELGHSLHHQAIGDEFTDLGYTELEPEEEALIAKEVSEYGSMDVAEMVAEVFAGRLAGKVYSKEVMDIYKKYKGPTV